VRKASLENEPFATGGPSGSLGRSGWASGEFGVSVNREDDMASMRLTVCRRRSETNGPIDVWVTVASTYSGWSLAGVKGYYDGCHAGMSVGVAQIRRQSDFKVPFLHAQVNKDSSALGYTSPQAYLYLLYFVAMS
jgi:hypothetical protein